MTGKKKPANKKKPPPPSRKPPTRKTTSKTVARKTAKKSSARKVIREWWVVELSNAGEMEPVSSLEINLKAATRTPAMELFIPAHIHRSAEQGEITEFLLPGYVFIAVDSMPDPSILGDSPFVKQVLTNGEAYAKVPNGEIERLRRQLSTYKVARLSVGDRAIINEGPYKNLTGIVIESKGDKVVIELKFRSIESVVELPTFMIDKA